MDRHHPQHLRPDSVGGRHRRGAEQHPLVRWRAQLEAHHRALHQPADRLHARGGVASANDYTCDQPLRVLCSFTSSACSGKQQHGTAAATAGLAGGWQLVCQAAVRLQVLLPAQTLLLPALCLALTQLLCPESSSILRRGGGVGWGGESLQCHQQMPRSSAVPNAIVSIAAQTTSY